MQRYANFTVALVAAVAALMQVLWRGSPIAWIASGLLFVALAVAAAMYFVGRRRQHDGPTETNTRLPSPALVIGSLISGRDQAIVMGNKVDSKINIFSGPPAQPAPPNDAKEPDDH
jgi:hypothetical protein